jgi:ComF family protein
MIDWALQWFSPHMCEGCGEVGKTLCKRCSFYIIGQKWTKCIRCDRQMTTSELAKRGNMCSDCISALPFYRVFVVGERAKILKKLVGNYKYFSRRESAKAIAELLDNVLPGENLQDLVIVPLPTIAKHIRERGFDHMKLVARQLSHSRSLKCDLNLLVRMDNVSQHSANFRQRQKQAAVAFGINLRHLMPKRILLIDDIYTSGATTVAAAELLKKHGAEEIWLGVVARHVDQKK